ncbi:MAG: hypothetical protein IT303_12895 [Dehalococcoidia bacterium]|nr:hypothetical protein [Dehalococcoidia bacterium]
MLAAAAVAVVLAAAAVVGVQLARSSEGERATVPPGEAERLGGDAVQQAALGDGAVTMTEYEEGVHATIACYRAAGIPVMDPVWTDGRLDYQAGPFATKAELDAAKPVMEACYQAHLRGLDVTRAAGQ